MAKKSKPVKPPKEPKPRKAAKVAAGIPTMAGANTMDPDARALFLKDKDDYRKAKDRAGKAAQVLRALGKVIKSDGFTIRQIKLVIQLETPEGEAEFKSLVANDLLAAQYAGAPVGAQLQLFLEPDRTPAVDIAYDEGVRDSMENKAAKPGYAPETEQYRRYMAGFNDDTERRLKAGIKPTDKPRGEVLADAREKNAQQADAGKFN